MAASEPPAGEVYGVAVPQAVWVDTLLDPGQPQSFLRCCDGSPVESVKSGMGVSPCAGLGPVVSTWR